MNKETRFSIITPIYNTKEEYLKECLNSSINQNYSNYEIILVDDGSNESTKSFLKNYEKNEKIKIIHQENKGIVGARLTGVSNANGEYIYFLDSDDICNSNLLNILNDIVAKYSPDIILHDGYRFSTDINNITNVNHFIPEGVVDKDVVIKQLLQLHINGVTNKIAKRVLFDSMEKSIDKSIINGEDLQQSTYLILKANTFYQTYEKLEYYRFNEENRDYYDVTKIHEVNFLLPTYNMMFNGNDKYNEYLPVYKIASMKAILYIAFQLCLTNNTKKDKFGLLDKLNSQPILSVISTIKKTNNKIVEFLYYLLINKKYNLLNIISRLYRIFF